jgi:hypothetical protein
MQLEERAFHNARLFISKGANKYQSRGSSVSIESGYGVDNRAIEVRTPAEEEWFFL